MQRPIAIDKSYIGLHLGYMLTAEPVTVVNDFVLSLGLNVISVSYKFLIS